MIRNNKFNTNLLSYLKPSINKNRDKKNLDNDLNKLDIIFNKLWNWIALRINSNIVYNKFVDKELLLIFIIRIIKIKTIHKNY